MTPDRAAFVVLEHLRTQFGALVRIRAPEQRRRAAGPTWSVPVVVPSSEGEIPVAEVDVDEDGRMSPVLDAEHVISAIRARPEVDPHPADGGFSQAEALFAEIAREAGEEQADVEASSRKLRDLFRKHDTDSLVEARRLLPHLLGSSTRRGRVLMMMAEVERRIGEPRLALGYLDAAAHELADRFDLATLEQAAAVALSITGEAGFVGSPIRALLHRCRDRLRPWTDMFDNPVLSLVPPEHRQTLDDATLIQVLAPGETLVAEGEPSRSLFVVKSGVVAVVHERPERRFVRCCSPGALLGESSVLVDRDPRCTATLRTDHLTEVWQIDAEAMRAVMDETPELRARMVEMKAVHGLDSFFSAHRSVGQLDAEVRDEMLKCMQSIQTFEERTIVIPSGAPPSAACLVARGKISLHDGANIDGPRVAEIGVDEFVGVGDILHRIATPRTAVAEPGSTIVFFDESALRELADRSPEQAVLVLERLG